MNIERLTQLAELFEALERGERHPQHPEMGFDMREWKSAASRVGRHDCGTVACIGGWTATLWPEQPANVTLGLSGAGMLDALFYMPRQSPALHHGTEGARVTPGMAARCIRHLIATGEVDWHRAMKEGARHDA